MKKTLLLLFFLSISSSLFASGGIVSGRVIAANNDSLTSYRVKLRTSKVLMEGSFLLPDFRIPSINGWVTITVSSRGYKTYRVKVKMSSSTNTDLGTIVLRRRW
ncbi:MAG: hypothetical protein LBU44_06015 [Mediterranea sp.]|jgi:hypothetical protein|nr:hypothetical protein [Mediterranea sp.]